MITLWVAGAIVVTALSHGLIPILPWGAGWTTPTHLDPCISGIKLQLFCGIWIKLA